MHLRYKQLRLKILYWSQLKSLLHHNYFDRSGMAFFPLFKCSVITKESDQKRPLAVSDITLFYRFTVLHAMQLFTSFWPAFDNVDAFPSQNFASIKTLRSSKPTQTLVIAFLFFINVVLKPTQTSVIALLLDILGWPQKNVNFVF